MSTVLFRKVRRTKHHKSHLQQYPGTPLRITVMPSRYFEWKSIADFCLALLLLLPGLPLMAIAFFVVRLTSRGPALFRQCRVGRNGKMFYLYKIRSMGVNAESCIGPAWAQTGDPRVTRIGHFLRKFHLDELPQLFNVLKGQMSLVGPRPERPEFVEVLSRQVPEYQNRVAVRPGITGLAQLNLPPDSDLDGVRRKVILDLEYIETAGPWLDLRLIVCTALRFLKLPVLRIIGLQRDVKLPAQEAENHESAAREAVVTLTQIQQEVNAHSSTINNSNAGRVRRNRDGGARSLRPR
jgi:lipopolysaccharide/colanic/teichoic acid biosynthesis glycosyltransferase